MRPDDTARTALLVVSFGGPEDPEDVLPFLRNVTEGRDVPAERIDEVAGQYRHLGGRSPINDQCRTLVAELERLLGSEGPLIPVYWGNRNWHPLLVDTLARMQADGVEHAFAFVTSAFSSYPGCRQYLEDIERARAPLGGRAPHVHKLRQFYDHPGFVGPLARNVAAALAELPEAERDAARLVHCAHSLPVAMARTSDYVAQLVETARLVTDRVSPGRRFDLVWQSRSGPPSVPWLGPDIVEHLEALAAEGIRAVVVAPTGFVSDHMEVRYDLDVRAAERARQLGITMVRAATPGADPEVVTMVRELVMERLDPSRPRRALGALGVRPDCCPATCCPPPERHFT